MGAGPGRFTAEVEFPRFGGHGVIRRRQLPIVRGLARFRGPDGSYRLQNTPLPDRARTMSADPVIREAGPGWTDGGIADQPAVADHAAFMNVLADDGFLLFAGPLAGSEGGRLRAPLVVDADSEDQIRNRVVTIPGSTRTGSCTGASSRGNLVIGAERLPTLASGILLRGRRARTRR